MYVWSLKQTDLGKHAFSFLPIYDRIPLHAVAQKHCRWKKPTQEAWKTNYSVWLPLLGMSNKSLRITQSEEKLVTAIVLSQHLPLHIPVTHQYQFFS